MTSKDPKRLTRNIVVPVIQVVISGVVLFVLYRFLYDQLGVSQIGVWSLIMAASSVSRIGELGLSAGVVRFVAQALGQNDEQRAAHVVQTTAITLGGAIGLALLAFYPLASTLLHYLLPQDQIAIALDIVPLAMGSIWLMVMTSVFSGGLDGCLRMDLRSMLMAGSHVLYLGLAFLLVPRFGLEGIAWAQLVQYGLLATSLWILLRAQLKSLPWIPLHWKKLLLIEMFGYGLRFQVITIVNMLFDPMVKVLMGKFGGLEALGLYEMANRLVLQCRGIIIEASRFMVPTVAALQRSKPEENKQLFNKAYNLNFYVSIFFYSLLGIFTTIISNLWLGHHQETFILFVLLLCIGWFGNTIIGPSYFSNLGSGHLRDNMISHVLSSLISLSTGAGFGYMFGGTGVAVGMVLGLLGGGLFLLVTHFRQLHLTCSQSLLPSGLVPSLATGICLVIFSNYYLGTSAPLYSRIALAVISTAILLGIMYTHPSRAALFRQKHH